jgi:hypothetical protein
MADPAVLGIAVGRVDPGVRDGGVTSRSKKARTLAGTPRDSAGSSPAGSGTLAVSRRSGSGSGLPCASRQIAAVSSRFQSFP